MRLGGAGSGDVMRVTQCEIVMGVDVGWGSLGLPSHYPGFIVPLLVRLWVGLQGRVRVCVAPGQIFRYYFQNIGGSTIWRIYIEILGPMVIFGPQHFNTVLFGVFCWSGARPDH